MRIHLYLLALALLASTAGAQTVTPSPGVIPGLSPGRVTYTDASGRLTDSANLTFDGTTLGGVAALFSGNITAGNLTDGGLTSGRVIYSTTAGLLRDISTFTFDGSLLSAPAVTASSTITAANLVDSALTAGRVVYTGALGILASAANFTFDGTTLTAPVVSFTTSLKVGGTTMADSSGNITATSFTGTTVAATTVLATTVGATNGIFTNLTDSSLTATRVPFAGVAGLLGDASGFTYAASTLTAPTINGSTDVQVAAASVLTALATPSAAGAGSTWGLAYSKSGNTATYSMVPDTTKAGTVTAAGFGINIGNTLTVSSGAIQFALGHSNTWTSAQTFNSAVATFGVGVSSAAITDTAMTAKSVLFAGTGGLVSQDNSNFAWDATNHWLGVGLSTPLVLAHFQGAANATTLRLDATQNAGSCYSELLFCQSGGLDGTAESTSIRSYANPGATTAASMAFCVTPTAGTLTEAMRLAGTGRLLMGTTTDDGINLLQVNGTVGLGSASSGGTGVVATALSVNGPVGSHTTTQDWMIVYVNGTKRWIPCF